MKKFFVAVVILGFAAGVSAQVPTTPESQKPGVQPGTSATQQGSSRNPSAASATAAAGDPAAIYDRAFSSFERKVISLAEAMPAEKYNFAPTNGEFTGVMTFADQMKHLTEELYYFFGSQSGEKADEAAIKNAKTKDEILANYHKALEMAHQTIRKMTAENAFQPIPGARGGATPAGMATAAIGDGYDHYGQLVEYLRMNGIVPPASRKK